MNSYFSIKITALKTLKENSMAILTGWCHSPEFLPKGYA